MTRRTKEERRPVFVFTDPGIDDSLALALMILSEKLEIIGAAGVSGNVISRRAVTNLAKLLELFNVSVPLFQGRIGNRHIVFPVHPAAVHGKDGLGGVELAAPAASKIRSILPSSMIAPFLERQSRSGRFAILSLGPLTDIAAALRIAPDLDAEEIVIMGGGISKGNVTKSAEFNVFCDPEAAQFVLHSESRIPRRLVTLDTTERVRLLPSDLERIGCSENPGVRTIGRMLEFHFDFHTRTEGFRGAFAHDPLAVSAFLWPTLFDFRAAYVDVDIGSGASRGKTIVDFRHDDDKNNPASRKVRVANRVKIRAVKSEILNTLAAG